MGQLSLELAPSSADPASGRTTARKKTKDDGAGGGGGPGVITGDLADQARRRYLNYALSVITARAIPDVRDGLKPVQRRILFTMFNDLHLTAEARHRKSAKVVGDVIGKYHPHGDTAVYDAMVRLAQSFAMREPLVEGQGNFGSIDGELKFDTADFRPTYDGTGKEPIVLPARFPQLLVNGTTGIAVGMATSIPPHNLGEVIKACVALIDTPNTTLRGLTRHIKGPDFPTGGQLVATREQLLDAYTTGRGNVKLRGTWKMFAAKGKEPPKIVIDSIPHAVEKSTLVEEIGGVILSKKLPVVVGVQDLSTEDVHVEIELNPKGDVDPELIMAYLFKHTRLQTTVKIDLNVLVPTDQVEISAPARLDLKSILRYFLDFRFATIKRRYEYELRKLEERIHVLEGFEIVFDELDKAIRIIRRSDGKADAAKKLIKAFSLTEIQAEAVLETKLYKLAKLEIEKIREELEDKRKRAGRIRSLLKSNKRLWGEVKKELQQLSGEYANRRRTAISDEDITEEFTAESFIVDEDAYVLVTRDGWIKRQRSMNLGTTRMREGDAPLAVVAGSTRECVVLFSNLGSAYVTRINDVPASSGHGTPVQKLFKFKDGERVIAAVGTDARVMEEFGFDKPDLGEDYEEPYPHLLAITKGGMSLRFTLWPHREVSNSRGRLYGRVKSGDEFVAVFKVYAEDDAVAVTRKGKVLCASVMAVNLLGGAGRGVRFIRVDASDEVVAAYPASHVAVLHRSSGGTLKLKAADRKVVGRGGKGRGVIGRGSIKRVELPPPQVPKLEEEDT
jgi:DNA gyrase subunit A